MSERVPAVSVCVPTYNGAEHLRACIDSILAQSFDDFELWAVDDHSSDDTVELLKAYAARDHRIRIERNPQNRGLVGNWNRCVELARAPWLKFVFQDDVLSAQCLERMMKAGEHGPPLVSCARTFLFSHTTPEPVRDAYARSRRLIASMYRDHATMSGAAFCEATLDHIGSNIVGEPTAVLLRTDLFARFGTFDSRLVTYCDAEYWTRVACTTGTRHIADDLVGFRVHEAATSATNVAQRRFRASVLDKLVLRHQMAYADAYAPLRAVAAQRKPPMDLAESYWENVHWAKYEAHAARDGEQPDDGPLREWQAFTSQWPALTTIPLKYRALRSWRALCRRAGR